jgi:2-dehydropantoate 2-reductase
MKIAILGGGAMGGLWASRLDGANEVTVIDASEVVVDAIARDGLVLVTADGSIVTRPRAVTHPTASASVDLLFVFVKAHHTASAVASAMPLIGPATTVVSLQNGWGNADVIGQAVPSDQLVIGVTYNSATVLGPGKIEQTGQGATYLGQPDGSTERGSVVATVLGEAGFEVVLSADVVTEIWRKLVLNTATLAVAALTTLRIVELSQRGAVLDLIDALAAETVDIATRMGLQIDVDERIGAIHALLENAGMGKASMLQDVEARRKTEIEVINGAVLRAAESHGVDAPLNRAMVALVGGLERSWQRA